MATSNENEESKTLGKQETLASDRPPDVRFYSTCCEGEQLEVLLNKLQRSLELAKASKGELSEKIWIKLQFAIGINDVTRQLERMPLSNSNLNSNTKQDKFIKVNHKASVPLQAVLLSTDCNPKWLTKHIPQIAALKNVPIISLKDKKTSSLRLGQLVNIKTALAIGIKERGSVINRAVEEFLCTVDN